MRVAIIAEGTRGDVHPMLALGVALARAGHQVRVCAPPDFADDAAARDLAFVAVGPSTRAYLTNTASVLHGAGVAMVREMRRYSALTMASAAEVLPAATADANFVLAGGTALLAGSIAELRGVPFRYVVYTPGLLPSAQHTPIVFPFQVRGRWANRVLWDVARMAMDWLGLANVNRHRRTFGLPRIPSLIPHVLSPCPLVAVDRGLAAVPSDCPFPFEQIRCLHPFDDEPLPADVERFLAAGPRPVYLGFGSMTDPDPETTTRRLLDGIAQIGCRAIISRGWAGLGDGPLPDGVMAVGPVSHPALFRRVALVVHHGGAGTTHTAARAGVPQVIVPHVLDQFYFADRMRDLGVAPPAVRRTRLDAATLVATLRAVLDDRATQARARDLGRLLADLGPTDPDPSVVLGTQATSASNALAA